MVLDGLLADLDADEADALRHTCRSGLFGLSPVLIPPPLCFIYPGGLFSFQVRQGGTSAAAG
ncbi:MAG: hypothetical protein ABI193_13435 [Minicystis sp.]